MSKIVVKPQAASDHPYVIIDRAVPADAEAVVELLRQTWFDTYPNTEAGITYEDIRRRVEGEKGEHIPQNIERWRSNIVTTDNSRAVYIARIGDEVVGMVAPSFVDGRRRVGALYVLPEVQGKGIGGKLMRKMLEWHGADNDIYLAVASYNQNAINFYQHFGFEQTNHVIRDEGDIYGNKEIPEIEMICRAR